MNVMLLTEHHLEFLSLKGGCTALYKCTLIKIPHSWKSHVTAHIFINIKLGPLTGTGRVSSKRAYEKQKIHGYKEDAIGEH